MRFNFENCYNEHIGNRVLLLCNIVQQTAPIMAEEELADFHKAPAHTVVADKRCRYHFATMDEFDNDEDNFDSDDLDSDDFSSDDFGSDDFGGDDF